MIAHVDMDAFFVSVELLRHPELRGRPVLVSTGTDPGARGVVMAASYEARRFGVHSALPLAIAHRRCPQAVLLPCDMRLYRRASRRVMEILAPYSDSIEVAGLDEAYVDLSGSPVPQARAREIKARVKEETGLTCSIGLAPNKLLAKIASDLDKPDGFLVLSREEMAEAVGERPASILPGVGPKTSERLEGLGIRTVGELASADPALLERSFGSKLGAALRDRANGVDRRELEKGRRRKSESRETTFSADVTDREQLENALRRLASRLCESLASHRHRGRTVTIKIRLRPFRTFTRSRTLPHPTRDPELVGSVALDLLRRFDPSAPVRMLGIGVAALEIDAEAQSDPAASAPAREGDDAAEPLTLDVAG